MNIDIGYFYMYMRMKLLQMLLYIRKRYAIRLHAYMAEDNPSTDCTGTSWANDEQIVLSLLAKFLSSLEIFAATATFFWTLLQIVNDQN